MDLDLFLNERLKFADYFFHNASKPFLEIISSIENEEPPFVPVYDETGEPQFLNEWQDARTGFDSVGLATLSMVASSLQLFLDDWVRYRVEARAGRKYSRKHRNGWLTAYRAILKAIGLDLASCPADLPLIEQAVLARNRGQHPDSLVILQTTHSRSDLAKYPNPYFVSDVDRRVIELDGGELSWWLSPSIYLDSQKLRNLISEISKLSGWLARIEM